MANDKERKDQPKQPDKGRPPQPQPLDDPQPPPPPPGPGGGTTEGPGK